MRRPVRNLRGGRSSTARTISAPVRGWDGRNSIDNMSAESALMIKNWFPDSDGLMTRPGFTTHCNTAETTPVGTVVEYEFASTHKLLASCNGKIFDVTTSTPSTLKTGLDASAVSFVTASMAGTMFLANGVDTLQKYDGSTVADATFTGLTLSDIDYIHTHKSRVYVIKKNTQEFWYGGTEAITGALTKFDLSLTGTFGGNLFAICSITRDGGAGPDDLIVFIFESGDCVVYNGSNPGDANNWSRVGIFKIGRPLSKQAVYQADADVYIVTDRGYEALSATLPFGQATRFDDVLSGGIQNPVLSRIKTAGPSSTWNVTLYPQAQMLIINVPVGASASEQHVMNINTSAWGRFLIPARSWGRFGRDCYFGDQTGKVHKFDDGTASDNGVPIRCEVQSAWTYFQDRGSIKKLNLVRPVFVAANLPPVSIAIGADFELITQGASVGLGANEQLHAWDAASSVWDVIEWPPEKTAQMVWYKDAAMGYALSPHISIDTVNDRVTWTSITYLYERGGLL